jgi:anaphase-promoting complex subunit 2
LEQEETSSALFEVVRVLQVTQAIYLHPLRNHVAPLLRDEGEKELLRIMESFHSLFAYSLSQHGLLAHLERFLQQRACDILGVGRVGRAEEDSASTQQQRRSTLRFMASLNDVGLGGAKAQRVFAQVMSNALSHHVRSAYAGRWTSPSRVLDELRGWIENEFARFVVEILACLKDEGESSADQLTKVTHADVEKWQEMGINKLGALRTSELFDVIVDWDNGSQGAIEDLKRYVTSTSARMRLTTSFTNVLSHRLLQPGASTTEILQVYIAIIRAFAVLDSKGVLLDRVARPVRRYLRERDDTVSIVVGGLLADPDDETNDPDVLVELAVEMDKLTTLTGVEEMDDGELDWDDMSWMPDPVDAGPGAFAILLTMQAFADNRTEYKKSKNLDVIGSLISLFDSKDIFVREFQKILGDRLLRREYDFDKEVGQPSWGPMNTPAHFQP